MDWLKEWDSEDEYHSSDDDPQHSFEQDLVSDIIKELERIYAVKARVNFDVFALKYSEGELMQPAPVEVVDQGGKIT